MEETECMWTDETQHENASSRTNSSLVHEISSRNNITMDLQQPSFPNSNGLNGADSIYDDSSFVSLKNIKKKKKVQTKLIYVQHNIDKIQGSMHVNSVQQGTSIMDEASSVTVSECGEVLEGNAKLVSTSVCPLCWKQFEKKENFSAHLKTCAVKHNLSLKQLMDALDLQTKQTEERKALGLPIVPQNVAAKRSSGRKCSSSKDGGDPDLELGLALSVSMREAEEHKLLQEQNALMEAGLGREIIATQATLLERFGFSSSRPVLNSALPPPRQGKLKFKGSAPVLLFRSQEERERLITEKVALILTADDSRAAVTEEAQHFSSETYADVTSEKLLECYCQECVLWNLASMLPADNDSNFYYVQNFSNCISPAKTKAGEKLRHLSQMPCRLSSPDRLCEMTMTSDSALKCEAESTGSAVQPRCPSSPSSPSSVFFMKAFAHDWKQLLNDSEMSDVAVFAKDGQKINAHKLVFSVRCPALMSDIQEERDGTCSLKSVLWSDVPYESAYAFLEFIYCGRINKIMKLTSGFESVLMLANRYNLTDLLDHLKLIERVVKSQELRAVAPQLSSNASPENSQSLLSPSRKHKRKSNCSIACNSGVVSPSSLKCSSPDPFSDGNMESSEQNNASTQQEMDRLMVLLGSSLSCNREKSEGESSCRSSQEKPCPSPLQLEHPYQLDSPKTLSKEKRKHIEDPKSEDEGVNLKLKRICVESKQSVRSSLLQKFTEVADVHQEEAAFTIDLTQSSGSGVKTSTPSSSQGSLQSAYSCVAPVHKTTSPVRSYDPTTSCQVIKDEISNLSVNSSGLVCKLKGGRTPEASDILGDFCADFEYNNYYYNYSPLKTYNNPWEEKSSPVANCEKRTPKTINASPMDSQRINIFTRGMRRSVSQNFLDNEVELTSSLLDSARSPASSPISVKCLSQDSIHLKSHNTPHNKEGKQKLAEGNTSNALFEVPLSQTLLNSVSSGQKTKSSGNHSLSSIQRMLEDSFVDELGSSALWRENIDSPSNVETKLCSTPEGRLVAKQASGVTPHAHASTRMGNDITPMPDYSGMKTPMLKRELQKYGLKPLKKRQAKLILRHIYDELHPYVEVGKTVPTSKTDEIPGQLPVRKTAMLKLTHKNVSESPLKTVHDKNCENIDTSFSSSQGSSSSQSDLLPAEEPTDDVSVSQTNPNDVKAAVEEVITSNESLHRRVLLYEPIWLQEIHSALKEKNCKFKLEHIIEFLDEECITFRTEQKRPAKKRSKKKT